MAVQGPMARAVAKAIAAVHDDRDEATRALARQYARLLDDARGKLTEAATYNELGPKLLAALTALGLTPAARGAAVARGGEPDAGSAGSTVAAARDEVEEQRRKRAAAR